MENTVLKAAESQYEKPVSDDRASDTDTEDEDDYIPPLPPSLQPPAATITSSRASTKPGPSIPTLDDLTLRQELLTSASHSRHSSLRLSRQADRLLQKEQLDELAPKADPGSRERKLEKRAEKTDVMRQFASARDEMEEVGEKELLGGGGDDAEEYRRMLDRQQRKKTEREVRREEIVRARNAEREERMKEFRAREEETVGKLREMARQRFG